MDPSKHETVSLGGQELPIILPSLTVRRDLSFAGAENERRAAIAALGVCVELPRCASDPVLGPQGLRSCKGSIYDFAELTEGVCERAGLNAWEVYRAGRACLLLCHRGAMPSLVEAVSRVDFGSAEEGKKSSPSDSVSSTAATPAGSTS